MHRLSGHIWVIAVGKLQKSYWQDASEEYLKRLDKYIDLTCISVRDLTGSSLPVGVALHREGKALMDRSSNALRRFGLTPTGKRMDSLQFSKFLQHQLEVYGKLAFLIGSPVGIAKDVLEACDELISLSPLTFPHELAQIVLLEQLYRTLTIIRSEGYHK